MAGKCTNSNGKFVIAKKRNHMGTWNFFVFTIVKIAMRNESYNLGFFVFQENALSAL